MLDLQSGKPWETVILTTLSRDRKLFPLLLTEARKLAQSAQVGRTVIFTAWGPEWRPFGQPRARRLLDSVVLDEGVKERVVDDVRAFMGRGRWYHERGQSFHPSLDRIAAHARCDQESRIGAATFSTVHPVPENHPSSKRSQESSSTTSVS